MIKRIAFTLLVLAAAAGSAAAQEKSPSNYAPGREALAEETFRRLIDVSSTLDMLNLAADVSYGGKITEDHPDLLTAMLENIIFDYCHVSDSLMTLENFRVKNSLGVKHYTLRSSREWDELGQRYRMQRALLENIDRNAPPLHLVSDPLTPKGLPELELKKIKPLRDDAAHIVVERRPESTPPAVATSRKGAARRVRR